jgi:hypothetical protein
MTAQAARGARALTSPCLRRLRPPGHGLLAEAFVTGETDKLGVDTERITGGRCGHRPATPSISDHLGGEAPDVQVSLPAGRGQGPTFDAAEVERIAPEKPRECSIVLDPAGRSRPEPESVKPRELASESVGAKWAAPEQGLLHRPTKRTRVRSKM